MQAVLARKRRGQELTREEILSFGRMVGSGDAKEEQIGAMLMAIAINGMKPQETADLTEAYVQSGLKLDWSGLNGIPADKHSTGGVGDKVSIPLAPILAQLGLLVPMISGRGLEITGGTLDKLESIPGYKTGLSPQEMEACLRSVGCFIGAATSEVCPADRKTYAIRDVTSTVDSTPLVTASILSKKIAEGCKFLIQDIKVGEMAFYKDEDSAEDLGKTMISTARLNGVEMVALLTRMDQPLGYYVGNSLEIEESVRILRGTDSPPGLMEITLELGGRLLVMTKLQPSLDVAKEEMLKTIRDGTALKRFEMMLTQQGVSKSDARELCYGDISKVLPQPKYTTEFKAPESGYIERISALKVGTVSFEMGSGRKAQSDPVDPSVGCVLRKGQGDPVEVGEVWATLHHNRPLPQPLVEEMVSALQVSKRPVTRESLLIKALS